MRRDDGNVIARSGSGHPERSGAESKDATIAERPIWCATRSPRRSAPRDDNAGEHATMTVTIALIGGGAIARVIARTLLDEHPHITVAGALHRNGKREPHCIDSRIAVTASLDELLSWRPMLVIECAGHAALAAHGAGVLEHGIDLVVASVGALANRDL